MQNSTPDSLDIPALDALPDLRAMSLSDFNTYVAVELLRCRRQLRAEEAARAGLETRIAGLESRERERDGGQ